MEGHDNFLNWANQEFQMNIKNATELANGVRALSLQGFI
jgi:hypothetical protein